VGIQHLVHDLCADGSQEQRVTVRRGLRDELGRNRSTCSGLVLYDYRLFQFLAESLPDKSTDNVGDASSPEGDYQPHWLYGVRFLCNGRHICQECSDYHYCPYEAGIVASAKTRHDVPLIGYYPAHILWIEIDPTGLCRKNR
jgi:hypothetical protein